MYPGAATIPAQTIKRQRTCTRASLIPLSIKPASDATHSLETVGSVLSQAAIGGPSEYARASVAFVLGKLAFLHGITQMCPYFARLDARQVF